MTFIVTSLRPHDIVITADSRATVQNDGKFAGFVDTCQKIFPVPDHSLAIVHYGENELGDEPMDKFIAGFITRLNAGNMTILEISDELRDYAHPAVRDCLKRLGEAGEHGCGFLIAGFGADDKGSMVVESFWKLRDDALVTEEKQWFPLSLIASGSGEQQAEATDVRQITDCPLEKVRAYNDHLLNEAIKAPVNPNSVGGKIHEVVVTRDKWVWTLPPSRPGPATQPGTKEA